jgi:hypothetical protein
MSVINTSVEAVDIILNEIQNTSTVIQASKNVSDFMKIDSFQGPNKDTLNLLYLMKELSNIKNVNSDIINIFVYSHNSDSVITTFELFMESKFFYSNGFFNIENVSYDEMIDNLFLNSNQNSIIPYQNIKINNISYNGYFYCMNNQNSSVVICLNDTIFNRTLKELNIGNMGLVCVTDSKGKLYYQSGNTENKFPSFYDKSKSEGAVEFVYNDTSYLSLWKQSEKAGLIYTAYIPKDLIMKQANMIKQITFIVFLCSVIFAITLALFLSGNNAKPIHEILNLFSPRPHRYLYKSVISHLKGDIEKIINSNSEIETRYLC